MLTVPESSVAGRLEKLQRRRSGLSFSEPTTLKRLSAASRTTRVESCADTAAGFDRSRAGRPHPTHESVSIR